MTTITGTHSTGSKKTSDTRSALPKVPASFTKNAARVDTEWLGRYLLGTWADVRLKARDLAAMPELQRIEGQSVAEHRATVFGQLNILV
jgi:acyl-CoA oxidase